MITSAGELSELLDMPLTTVTEAINVLVDKKLITWVSRRKNNVPVQEAHILFSEEKTNSNLPAIQNKTVAPVRGTRMKEDWFLSKALGEWTVQYLGYTRQEVMQAQDEFRDYWLARSDSDAIKLDWDATWRNWMRRNRRAPQIARHTTFAQQTREFQKAESKQAFRHILNASDEVAAAWGFIAGEASEQPG